MNTLTDHTNEPSPRASCEALVTAVQVAKRLGVSERWVRDHATRRSPRLPVVKLGSLDVVSEAEVPAHVHPGPRLRRIIERCDTRPR
jgi:hypothetical protein